MESINQVLKDYKLHVQTIENTDLTKIRNLKDGMHLSDQTIWSLRTLVREHNGFGTQEDEIHFFKNIKPFILGRLQFFLELQTFELKWPKADVKCQKRYIRTALKKIDEHKNNNINFWRYVKNKQSQQDSFYFLRSTRQIGINCDMSQYIVDPEFSTSYDNLMAHFVAAELLTKHYKKLLFRVTNKEPDPIAEMILNKNRSWSGSKTDLVELIYALHSSGVLNNGEAEISKIIQFSEKFFNIKIGNAYKTFAEIKAREKDRTKFLDTLKLALLAKMDTDEAITKS